MKAGSKILVAPLDWGLGHASRCVPIVRFFIANGFEVVLGGGGDSLRYLCTRFPELTYVELPSARMTYGRRGMVSLPFLFSMFRFASNIRREHRALEKIISDYSIDYVFSDNRLGLYSEAVPSFYMTHQLNFDNGFLNRSAARMMKRLHLRYINKYRYCLVPDVDGEMSLSGKMSNTDLSVKHIGPLSRFYGMKVAKVDEEFDLLLLSGVEPQRTVLENIFIKKYSSMPNARLHIIRGVPSGDEISLPANITSENNPSDERIASLIVSAHRVFCRSGYSSLCDLAALGRRAVLVPTPRQPEQEYLAEHFKGKFGFVAYSQDELQNLDLQEIHYESEWNYSYLCKIDEIMNLVNMGA
ncbi:MAG: hypothetical protein J5542_00115 [Bacteroidales bacterium]|nr:hypothetical protein [Bacteroidales bacterium]